MQSKYTYDGMILTQTRVNLFLLYNKSNLGFMIYALRDVDRGRYMRTASVGHVSNIFSCRTRRTMPDLF